MSYGLYNNQMFDSARGKNSAPGSGYLSSAIGNYWAPSTIDRARKYITTGNADYLYKTDQRSPERTFIMIMGGDKAWRKKAQQMDKDNIPYYNPEGLEDVRQANQSLKPKVPRKVYTPEPSQIWFTANPNGTYTVKPKVKRKP